MSNLLEQRNEAYKAIRAMADNADSDQWDQEKWERVNKEYDSLDHRISVQNRADKLDQQLRGVPDTPFRPALDEQPDYNDALQAFCRAQAGFELSDRHARAAQHYGVNLRSPEMEVPLKTNKMNLRAMSTSSPSEIVPDSFSAQVEQVLETWGGILPVANVLQTSSGEPIDFPVSDTTAASGAVVMGEGTQIASTDYGFSTVRLSSYKYGDSVLVNNELLSDSAINLTSFLADELGNKLGKGLSRDLTVGDGSGKPTGFLTDSALGVTAASSSAITSDEILELIHSVDPAYRTNAVFMCHDSTVLALRKLRNSEGDFLWQESMRQGMPSTLLGVPIMVNQHMPQISTGNKVLAYGDFSRFRVRRVGGLRLMRSDQRYIEMDQTFWAGLLRADSKLFVPAAVKHLKMA